MAEQIGLIGLGIMGTPMGRNLLKAGFKVSVYNRTASRADKLSAAGALKVASVRELASECSIIITMVTDTPDVESIILGEEGVISSIKPGSVVIDMSTISPETTHRIACCLHEKGVHMLDAPVSGGETGAVAGSLSIMVGGEAAIVKRCQPIFQALGQSLNHVGPAGMGQTVKLMNQILVVGNLNAVVEALVFARSQGVDPEKAIEAVKGGAAGSWQLANLGPKILARDFKPGFMVDLVQKDLRLVLEAAEMKKLPLPVTSLVHQMFYSLQASGEGKNGTQALVKALERLARMETS